MQALYRVMRIVWSPVHTLSEACEHPIVVIPILIPTALATLAAIIQYFGFVVLQPELQTAWIVGLVVSAVRPVLIPLVVSAILFALFSVAGRSHGYFSFLSVTALAFVPTSAVHLVQSGIFFFSESPLSAQAGRVNLTYFLDPQVVAPGIYVAAGMIDLVSLWVLGLLVVGHRMLGVRSGRLNGSLVLGSWVVYAIVRIAMAGTLAF
jgi:hypothetical protein